MTLLQTIFHPDRTTFWSILPLIGYYVLIRCAFMYFSGIRKLAHQYRITQDRAPGTIHRWQSCRFNAIKNLFSTDIGVSPGGLYLKNLMSPAIQIPWDHIERLPDQKHTLSAEARFRLGQNPSIRFGILESLPLAKEIAAYKPMT